MTEQAASAEAKVVGTAWNDLDDRTQTLLYPMIDSGVLVTYRDAASGKVMVTFAANTAPSCLEPLRDFIFGSRDFLAWRQKLQARASIWNLGERGAELLLSETETREALRWRAERAKELTDLERTYIDECAKAQHGFSSGILLEAITKPTEGAGEYTRLFRPPSSPPTQETPSPKLDPAEVARWYNAAQQARQANAPQQAGSSSDASALFRVALEVPAPAPAPGPAPPPTTAGRIANPYRGPDLVQPPSISSELPPSVPARRFPILIVTAAALLVLAVIGGLTFFLLLRSKSAAPSPSAASSPAAVASGAVKTGNYDQAISTLTRAIEAGQPLYADRAYAYRLAGNLKAAIEDYRRAIQAGNATDQTLSDLAYTFSLEGDYGSATRELTQAIHQNPTKGRYYVDRGNAYMAQGFSNLALTDFENALRIDPGSAAAQTGKANALQALKLPVTPGDAPPRVYIQIASEAQRRQALILAGMLTELGYEAPPAEIVGQRSPSQNQLRYIYRDDQSQAETLAIQLKQAGISVVVTQIPAGTSKDVRPRQFELWLAASNAGAQQAY